MNLQTNVLIIGAGHMGLALGGRLKALNVDYLILDKHEHVGDQWRKRYQGLTLFTPNKLNRLPGFYIPHSQGDYLTKDEFADYLSEFALHHQLAVKTNCHVLKVTHDGINEFSVFTAHGVIKAKQIVLATGAFNMPVKLFNGDTQFLQLDLEQLQRMNFKNQQILVVGDGASGRQIAKKLSDKNKVYLAQGKKRNLFPEHILGLKTFSLLKWFGLLRLPKSFKIAQFLKSRDPFPDTNINNKALLALGVDLKSRVVSVGDECITFDNGEKIAPDILISAIGYKDDFSFIQIPQLHKDNNEFDVSTAETMGIFQIGRPWQHNRASGLICGAEFEVENVLKKLYQS
ncbi:NAD(P)-binding domain-containing protein [Pseudoalteromonas sp. BZB3]|uniref:NAD(P)-binding domain-containing protein n=1 Tax=Pseudoalteromonas sp. BZB3 TaxID=3136670 RepID=UPI0032C46A8E